MNFETLAQNILLINLWVVVKWALVMGLTIYAIFAMVVVRQVGLMTRTVKGELDGILKLGAWLHLGLAAVILIIALVWL